MRSLNYKEVKLVQSEIEFLTKGQLQWVKLLYQKLQLGFWMSPGLVVLEFSFGPKSSPFLWVIDGDSSRGLKGEKKPLSQFIEKHFKNCLLHEVQYDGDHGRKIILQFEGERTLGFELIPHSPNVEAYSQGKSVFLNKPVVRPASQFVLGEDIEIRTFDDLQRQFSSLLMASKKPDKNRASKKSKAKIIEQIKRGIEERQKQKWGDYALWLQQNSESSPLPESFKVYWKEEMSHIQNMNFAFEQDKKNREKILASQARMAELLQNGEGTEKKDKIISRPTFKGKAPQFFTSKIGERWELLIGKSAKDNLALLRKARSWDLWFHIKDQPGSHGVVFVHKGQRVEEKFIPEICQILLEKTFKSKASRMRGLKFEVLCAEVRHVQPIKGDKMGRVTVRNEKTFLHLFT